MERAEFKEIEKETLKAIELFPVDDVLQDEKQRKERLTSLEMGVMYGNTAHFKAKIFFKDAYETRFIRASLWGIRDNMAILRGGGKIPVHRIIEIKFP